FLVCRGTLDKPIGVVHVKDVLKVGLFAGEEMKVGELARPPIYVPSAAKGLKVLDLFRETETHVAIVVDEFGGTEGLVTLNDRVGAIVGEIGGTEASIEEPVKRSDGSWLIDAALPVGEFFSVLGLQADTFREYSTVNTVGGLVLALLGHLPKAGEKA